MYWQASIAHTRRSNLNGSLPKLSLKVATDWAVTVGHSSVDEKRGSVDRM
jgi:hypothetical protein